MRRVNFSQFVTERDRDVCWPWLGPVDQEGYGMFRNNRAARESYKRAYGEVPTGKIVHHICRNKPCVNDRHLIAVFPINHSDDGAARNRSKTLCKHGHSLTNSNSYIRTRFRDDKIRKERVCRSCIKAAKHKNLIERTK